MNISFWSWIKREKKRIREKRRERKKKKKKRKEKKKEGKEKEDHMYGYMFWVVWNLSMVLYGTMSICMETMGVWNARILYRKVWNV